ncbi:Ldh family oxidoreductase [Amycolatopsis jiangsuensis]|uniref:LDH2 family malate/lactate/ureidoglycolate dehydrogenase n=1 Tax=Amycolatopsis jiangsuensis TaxID=1181879 RepID=A0A840J2E6_9PSEU|nr:Ldh family oxidoreductase [Amycolatopsis jiangsuensis]MBB4688220.1 LDH2 family malate/lactate/ureidoglycolate dehydrogenase [Amycolatopsis jiangsuensis]
MKLFSEQAILTQIRSVLTAWGMPKDAVDTTAAAMVYADLSGIDSHGISMLMMYEKLRGNGHLDLHARPVVERENAAMALLDAGGGLGHPAAVAAMNLAIDKAHSAGVGIVSVHNSRHFGAAGYYANFAAEAGLVGLVTASAKVTSVVPTGAAVPMLSTNPIAFAAPARHNPPFLLDMSTSTVASNKVKVYDLHEATMPEGWVVDESGRPVTDAGEAMAWIHNRTGGGLTPLGGSGTTGGHKGYGLAVMVQILSAALSGADLAATRRPGAAEDIGHFFLALDPGFFRTGDEFLDDVDELVDTLRATPPAKAGTPVQVAGDPERRNRERRRTQGIPLPDSLITKIAAICERAHIPLMLDHPIQEN